MQNIYNSVYMHIVYSIYAIYKNTYYVRRAAGGGDIVYLHTPKPTLTDGYSSRTQTHTHTHTRSFVVHIPTYTHTYVHEYDLPTGLIPAPTAALQLFPQQTLRPVAAFFRIITAHTGFVPRSL